MFFTLTVELFKREVGTQTLAIEVGELFQEDKIVPTVERGFSADAFDLAYL